MANKTPPKTKTAYPHTVKETKLRSKRCLQKSNSANEWRSLHWGSAIPGGSNDKESVCNAGHLGSIPGSGRSPGGGNGNPLPYSCLESSMDRGAWWATVHEAAKSRTQLKGVTQQHGSHITAHSLPCGSTGQGAEKARTRDPCSDLSSLCLGTSVSTCYP